jgi:peptidoglycan hydrolase-like protein with peptidoglycan-binding domain
MRRVLVGIISFLVVAAALGTVFAVIRTDDKTDRATPAQTPTTSTASTTSTTTTTLPPLTTPPTSPSGIVQPIEARLPLPPPEGVGPGARGPIVQAYQERLAAVHFDPGRSTVSTDPVSSSPSRRCRS